MDKKSLDTNELQNETPIDVMATMIEEPAVVHRLEQRSSLEQFTSDSTVAAAVMVFAAIAAVFVANSPAYEAVHAAFEAPFTLGLGAFTFSVTVEQLINDGLMTLFFMLVGVELKYEMTVGQLRRPKQAALPMLAAVGGVAAPALIYLAINAGGAPHGWATTIATDIAFAIGVMSLLGDRIAPETKIFFQTLAIADDILAIVVLALFYGQTIDVMWVAASLAAVLVLWILNRRRVYSLKSYTVVGIVLWFCMFNSGIHATLAGVILAFFLPARSDVRLDDLPGWLHEEGVKLDDEYDDESHVLGQHDFTAAAWAVERVMHHVRPPLQRAERNLSAPVNFFILPLFAFVNAQVRVVGIDPMTIVADPIAQGVFLGAVLGKPIGIIGITFILVKTGLFRLPVHVDWRQITAVGIMGGIGFTMSILIAGLAFVPAETNAAKCAILAAAIVSSAAGLLYVRITDAVRGAREAKEPAEA